MTDNAVPADADDYEDNPEEDGNGTVLLDLAVGTLAGAVTGVVGYAVGGVDGALVSNTGSPFLAAVFKKFVGPFWEDRERRAEKMLETAAETAGLTQEELADRAAESEESRFLTNKAVQAAADTIWPEGIRAIGRAFAAGLLARDKTALNIRLRVLGIMQDLDELHVTLLELLVKYEPEMRYDGLKAIPQRFPSYVNQSGADDPMVWSVANRNWMTWHISAARPRLEPILPSLLGELRERGLVRENDIAPDAFERLSDDLVKQVNRHAGQLGNARTKPLTLKPVTFHDSGPTWSPTELGEKILGFYAEAGAEDGQDQGQNPGEATS